MTTSTFPTTIVLTLRIEKRNPGDEGRRKE